MLTTTTTPGVLRRLRQVRTLRVEVLCGDFEQALPRARESEVVVGGGCYRMTYPTPDAGALATKVAGLMPATEPVHEHASRGLDHGAWVPLKVMYPMAS